MAKIMCPNEDYTGVAASVAFVNGEGRTTDAYLIEWFRDNGYEVLDEENEEPAQSVDGIDYETMTHKELKALAKEKGLNAAGSKEEIIKELKGEHDGDNKKTGDTSK